MVPEAPFPFTTAYHTQFPEYVAKRSGLPPHWFWRYIRWFHGPAEAVLVATPTLAQQLASHGLLRTKPWGRGVDLDCFTPDGPLHPKLENLPRPIQLYVGRIAVEKNIEAFLQADSPGSKVVVGEGPMLDALRSRFPAAHFLGAMHGADLAAAYRTADVFVFPSRTDTFGLVMIEALASGTPVAAFPVPGPIDVLRPDVGSLKPDLAQAIAEALLLDRRACAQYGACFSWTSSTQQLLQNLSPGGRQCAPVRSRPIAMSQ